MSRGDLFLPQPPAIHPSQLAEHWTPVLFRAEQRPDGKGVSDGRCGQGWVRRGEGKSGLFASRSFFPLQVLLLGEAGGSTDAVAAVEQQQKTEPAPIGLAKGFGR